MSLYIGGSEVTGGYSGSGGSMASGASSATMGRRTSGWIFNGIMDEVRISSGDRGACWIGTSYNNQNNPGDVGSPGFYSVGGEEALPALTLANHASGQVADKFSAASPVTDVLYRFKLTRSGCSGTVTVDNLRVKFTTAGGVANGDVTSGQLWVDNNNDGAIDGGDTQIQGSVTPVAGVLTFTTNFTPGTSGTNYLVRATVSNLAAGDTTTFSVVAADIDEVESVTESGSISSIAHTADSCTFNYRKTITVQSGQVTSGPHANFPMLVNISIDNNLRTVANGGHVTSASGYDIIFRATDDTTCGGAGTSPCTLDHEIEKYEPTTGKLVAWVRVPSINNGTVITMLYGNGCITSSTEHKTGVWNANYLAVYHLNQSPAGTVLDSTSHQVGLTPAGSMGLDNLVAAEIGDGIYFNKVNFDRLVSTSTVTMTSFTIEAWISSDDWTDWRTIVDIDKNSDPPAYRDFAIIYGYIGVDGGTAYQLSTTMSGTTWRHVVATYNSGNNELRGFVNGSQTSFTPSPSPVLAAITGRVIAGAWWNYGSPGFTDFYDGKLDEIRISNTARPAGWILTEFNNQSAPSSFYSLAAEQGVTAISLLSFTAKGEGSAVQVDWQTAQEVRNKGFNLYRSEGPGGVWVKLNAALIPAASGSGGGSSYRFTDRPPVVGRLYYYRLEDVDVSGAVTSHGPVCVDWDADGMPDDWEIAHGLNPAVNDAGLDSDGDGVPNWLEYLRGTNPLVWDSDGDGISDGLEQKSPGYLGGGAAAGFGDAGVQVLAQDAEGLTLELWTRSFEATPVEAGGQVFERLRIPSYVHGLTRESGLPQMPVKGILLDIPEGRLASVEVLEADERVLSGYRVYPAPEYQLTENNQLVEVFRLNEAGYRQNTYYPAVAAELSTEYVFRGEVKQRLVFYPLRFNPATGELIYSERMRVRIKFADTQPAASSAAAVQRAPGAGGVYRAVAAGEGGWVRPAGTALKLSTNGEGIYRITRAGLLAAGIGASEIDAIDLSGVQLFQLGVEQAMHVVDVNGNRRLEAGDSLTFYAAAVPAGYAKYARYNIYWLVNAGSAAPLRMGTIDGTPLGGPLAASHASTVHHELNQTYLQSAVGADGLERWIFSAVAMGGGFAGGGVAKDFTFSVPGALATGDLTIRLYSPYEMAHETQVFLNGVVLGSAVWNGIGWTEATFAGVALLDGANTVSILCQGALDKTAVDWMEVDYARAFEAVSDSLKFSHAAGYRYRIADFGTTDVEVYDITDAAAVQRVVNGTYTGAGPYTLEVQPEAASGSRSYLAVGAAALKTPVAVVRDSASSLASAANAADWILITHGDIGWEPGGAERGWVTELVALRQSQGLRTKLVDVEDIFDEFGYGLPTPEAIKAFLAYAYENWQAPAPQYVLLVGDTSYDYKDNWGIGTVNHVPGYLIYTANLGETVCEECYGQVSGNDALADLYIGRLPAASAAQAEAMVSKIIAYETAVNRKLWERRLVLVADNQAEDWEAVFETMNEDAAAQLPAGMDSPERFYLQEYENEALAVADLTAELLSAIEAGALIVNYSGHGSLNIWATERIIDNRGGAYRSDVTGLANSGMYPFVVNLSCLTGYFIYPKAGAYAASSWRSLAEGWIWPETAGAVAALMPTGMTDADGQHLLSNALYEGIFALDQRRLGPAMAYAKQQLLANGGGAYEETSNTFMLFGDPATELKVPLPRRPATLTAELQRASVRLSWATTVDCDGNPVAGYNLYRRLSTEESYTKLNTALITGLAYTDAGLAAGETYYYALSAVDSANDESVKSAPAVVTLGVAQSISGGSGSGGVCFISAVAADLALDLVKPFGILALLACLIWIEQKNRGPKQRRKQKDRCVRGAAARLRRGDRSARLAYRRGVRSAALKERPSALRSGAPRL